MKSAGKLYWIAVFGTIWGTIELFGGDLMRVYKLPYKAAILSALAIAILLIAKRVVPQIGSVIAVGLVACLYKLASNGFYSCQLLAVMIHALTFEIAYLLLRERMASSARTRALAAVGITAVSFSLFGFLNTYVIPEPHWAERGLPGIADYLRGNGVVCALLSVVTMELGHQLARRRDAAFLDGLVVWRAFPLGISASLMIACWAAGVFFALAS